MAALATDAVEAITTAMGVTAEALTDSGITDSPNGATDSGVTDPVNGGGDGDDDDDDVDTTIIIVICVIIGLLLLVFIVALCKYMEMRRRDDKRPQSTRSGSDYQEYPPSKSSMAKYQSSFTSHDPYAVTPAMGIDRRSTKRTSFKEPGRGGSAVYSVPLKADVTLPQQQNGGPYGVVIGDIGKKTGGPTYSQGVQGTVPTGNQQYSTLPLPAAQRSVTTPYQPPSYQPPSTNVSAMATNGTLFQRADGFTVFEPKTGGGNPLIAPVPTGPIVPQQADIYYQGSRAGQAYSDYETVSRVNVPS